MFVPDTARKFTEKEVLSMHRTCAAALVLACLALPVSAAETAPAETAPVSPAAPLSETASVPAPAEETAESSVIGSADGPTAVFIASGAPADSPPDASASASPAPLAEAADAAAEDIVRSHPVEVQFEYIEHRAYKHRHIDNYTVHLYQEMKRNGTVSFWRGLTLTRPTGYLVEDDGSHRNSDSWGVGPSFMIRWEKPVSEKWSVGLDGTGSLLAYNHAFPAGGRAFGFMWRVGPRVSYYPDKDSAIRLGWSFMHCSNGFSDHNPGYNGVGFSLMYAHNF